VNLPDRIALGYRCALVGSVFLLVCAAVPLLFGASIAGWLIQSLPLVLILPGLMRGDRRSLQWLGFVTLFLLVPGILQLFTPDPRYRLLGWCKVVGSLAVFGIAVYTARLSRASSSRSIPPSSPGAAP
jgi:uncharacterized membrane protein